jgi:hypothetical protein
MTSPPPTRPVERTPSLWRPTVNVTGCTLKVTVGSAAAIGDSYVIISNHGNSPVVGTFNNLAEGAKFVINGMRFQITYKGGAGHDVVIITPA